MGAADRAGPRHPGTAADERCDAGGVVRRHERRPGDQRRVTGQQTRHRMDRRDLQGLGVRQLGNKPGSRCASIVFPTPGGPVIIRWCAPAAATSTAKRAWVCPTTSVRSRSG